MLQFAHHSHYHTPRLTELRHLYWSHGLAALGAASVQVLAPVYLLKIGYSVEQVVLFFLLAFAISGPLYFLAAWLISKVNANRIMALAEVSTALFLASLFLLPILDWPIWWAAIFKGADRALYWPAFHASFSKSEAHRRRGSQVGLMNALVIGAHGVAPAAGGVIATVFGIGWVYGIAGGLLLSAGLILFRSPNVVKHRPLDLRLLHRRILPDLAANFSQSTFYVVEGVVWPILIFLIIPTYAGVGVLSSVAVLSAAAVSLSVGRREDKRGERRYLKRGAIAMSGTNAFRMLASSTSHVAGVNLFSGLGQSLLTTSYLSRYYKHADEEPRLEYVLAMEVAHVIGLICQLSLLLLLLQVVPDKAALLALVFLGIPLSLGVRWIR
ncbi:MAG: MFS transporter [bacterium]|nr:MFS transporter [bacterium]